MNKSTDSDSATAVSAEAIIELLRGNRRDLDQVEIEDLGYMFSAVNRIAGIGRLKLSILCGSDSPGVLNFSILEFESFLYSEDIQAGVLEIVSNLVQAFDPNYAVATTFASISENYNQPPWNAPSVYRYVNLPNEKTDICNQSFPSSP